MRDYKYYEQRSEKVNRMLKVLVKKGWTFKFRVEAVSPRGFEYQADGGTGEEAFLRALGQWRRQASQ